MQQRLGMKPLLVVAALLAGIAASAPAGAGGYVAVGLGSDAVLTGDLDEQFDAESTGSGRLALGVRTGPLALEASAFGAPFAVLPVARGEPPRGDFAPVSLGVDVKYHVSLPLIPWVEGYGRAGLNRTWLLGSGQGIAGGHYAGRGYALGGGAQIPFRSLAIVQAAIWVDYTRHTMRLRSASGPEVGGNAHMVMLGISLGTRL